MPSAHNERLALQRNNMKQPKSALITAFLASTAAVAEARRLAKPVSGATGWVPANRRQMQ
jgi:hypothetical protein